MYSGNREVNWNIFHHTYLVCFKKLNGFHCECPEKGGIFGRFCQVRAPRGCQGENVRKMATRHFVSEHLESMAENCS
jgi:hypothetical protein